MAEKAVVEGALSESIELVKRLDAGETKPMFVAWYFYEDANEWKLLLSGPKFDQLLNKNEALAYQKIAEIITSAALNSLSISVVKLVESKNALPQALKRLIDTGPDGIVQAYFTDITINGIFIKGMIILRSAA